MLAAAQGMGGGGGAPAQVSELSASSDTTRDTPISTGYYITSTMPKRRASEPARPYHEAEYIGSIAPHQRRRIAPTPITLRPHHVLNRTATVALQSPI